MSKVEVIECDRCNARGLPCANVKGISDRRMDAAGSMENHWFSDDYCLKCLETIVNKLLKSMDYKAVQEFSRLRFSAQIPSGMFTFTKTPESS